MAWFGLTFVSDWLQQRFARFALQKTLGQFLRYKLETEQISVNSSGEFKLTDLELDVQALDSLLQGTPLQVVDGYIESVSGRIPYARLLTEGCEVNISGVEVVLKPRDEADRYDTMVDPATSMMHVIDELRDTVEELGEELARDMAPPELNKRATEDGVKSLAYAAKRVMSQVHVTVKNVQIRVIFPRPGESQCTCFCFQLGQAELRDATADAAVADDPASPAARQPVPRADSLDVTSSPHSVKHVQLSDYGLYVETGQTSAGDDNHSLTIVERIPLVQFLSPATKPDFVSITLQHVFLPTTPKVDVEAFLHGMYVAVSPALLVELTQFVSLLTAAGPNRPPLRATEPTPEMLTSSTVDEAALKIWNQSWRINLNLSRCALAMAYEPVGPGRPRSTAAGGDVSSAISGFVPNFAFLAESLKQADSFKYDLATSPAFSLVTQPHLHLSFAGMRMALGSASSTVTVLLRDLGVFDVDFEGAGSAIIYDILTTAPLAGKGTAADDQPAVVTDDADALRLLFNRRAAGVQIEFQRLLRLALDISVADRLYGYEAAFVAASGTNSATVSKPATATATTTTTSTTASKGTTFLAEIALPSVDIVLAIPLAPMMQTARSHNARGWLQRPAYRQANVHCHLDDAHMTLRLGGAVTAADYHQDDSDRVVHAPHASPPSTPLPPSPPCMTQVELRARRVAVALKQTSDPRPVTLIVLNSDVGATAIAVDMRLQRPPVAPGKGIGRPVTEVSSPLGCARHDKNMSRSGLDKWLRRCASGARICINVKCDSMIADLPRARAEALVQLLLELGEWVPWSTLHHRALAAVAAAAASSAANAESMRRVETDSSWGDMDSHTTDSRQAQGPGLRRVRDSDDDTSTIPPDDDARTAAVTASAWSGLVKPHEAAMTIRSRRATVVLHEATVGDVITTTTCFKLQLEEALIAVGHGLGGSGHRALLLRGRHSSLMQVDPTLELAPPPHKHNQRAIYDVDATLRPRGTEPTAVDDVEEDDFAVAMLTQPASAHALTRVAFVLDFAQLCFQHFEDPRGHWLTRCLKLLSFPDPPDWPRPADRPPSILGLTVHFNHCAVLMEPMHKPLAGKLLLPQLHVGSNIASGTPLTLVEMHVTEARLLLIDDRQKLRLVDRPLRPQELLWAAQGWQSVVDAEHLHLTLRFSDSPNHTALSVALTDWTVTITTCADSFVTLLAFASALVDDKPPSNGEAGDGGNGAGNKVSNSDMSSTAIELQHIPRGWSTAAGSMAGTMAYSSAVSASSAAVYASAAPLPVVHTPPQLRLTSDALRAHEQQHQQLFGRGQHLSATQNAGGAEAAAEGEGEEEDEEEEAAASNSSTSAIEDDEEEAFQSAEEGSDDDNNAQQTDNSGVEAPPAELAHGRSAEASADASLLDSSEVDVMPAPPAALLITTVSQDMRDAMSSTGSAEPTPKTVPKGGFVFDLDEDYFAHSQTPANSTFSESSAAAAAPTAGARTGGARHSPIFQDAHEVVFGEEFPSSLAESLREASHSPSPERAQLGAHADSATARRSSAPAAQPRLATVAGGNVRSTSTSSAATAASASTPTVTTPQLATITYLGQPDRAVNVLTDYFQPPPPQYDADLKPHDFLPKTPKQHVELKRMNVTWNLVAGRDWRIDTDDDLSGGKTGPLRKEDCGITLKLTNLNVVRDAYPRGEAYRSRLLLVLRRMEIEDRVPMSFVKVMLTDYAPPSMPRERDSNVLRVEMMDVVTPDAAGRGDPETILQVRALPLRLNIDQDTLNFVVGFLTHVPGTSESGIEQGWEDVVYPPPDEIQQQRQRLVEHIRAVEESSRRRMAAGEMDDNGDVMAALRGLANANPGGMGEAAAAELREALGHMAAAANRGTSPIVESSGPSEFLASRGTSVATELPEDLFADADNAAGEDVREGPPHRGNGAASVSPQRSNRSGEDDSESPTTFTASAETKSDGVYFKVVDVGQLVFCVDYEPKRLSVNDLLNGDIVQLAGLVMLNNAHVILTPALVKGVCGWDRLQKALVDAWWRSMSRSQISSLVIAGIPGGSNVSNLVAASAGVLHQPVQQYPYVLKGMRDGLYNGLVTTTVEMCNVGTTLLFGLQTALELAQGLTPAGADEHRASLHRSRLWRQPRGVSEGLYLSYRELMNSMRRGYEHVAVRPLERSGGALTPSVLVRMLGAVPAAGLEPIIGLCEATALSLQGLRNSVNPASGRELQQKFKPGANSANF